MTVVLSVVALLSLVLVPCSCAEPKLLLISLDGFYYKYLDMFPDETVFMRRYFADQGVHAVNGMKPPFATKTFAVHWTIATGLYEEEHGILMNQFYDPDYNETFTCKKSSEEKWFSGDPIWSTAVRQGKKVAVLQWIGSAVKFTDHRRPATFVQAHSSCTHAGEIRNKLTLVHELLFDNDFDFVMLYFHEPDDSGHWHGAASEAVRRAIQVIDHALREFVQRAQERHDLDQELNFIILSGNGKRASHSLLILQRHRPRDEEHQSLGVSGRLLAAGEKDAPDHGVHGQQRDRDGDLAEGGNDGLCVPVTDEYE